MASVELQHQIEQFLRKEARLLDDGLFDEWLALFAPNARYWMPTRDTRERGEPDVNDQGAVSIFQDDKAFLTMRVRRFDTGLAHAEQPASRTRHFISNVEIVAEDGEGVEVHSNVLVYQNRLESTESFFVGKRVDRLRRDGESWLIVDRKVVLDQTLLPRSLSIFF